METTTLLIVGIGLLSLILLATIFVLILYSGLFDGVQVGAGKPLVSNLKVVYKYGKGPTKDMGALFTEVTCIAPKLKCFGVYYDDPMQQHPVREHHWAVGCVLAEGAATPDSSLLTKFREEGYKTFAFPEVSHVVHTQFPCRTQLSILLGIYKVYPQLNAYVKKQRLCAHPWLEIYNGETIYYMGPLAKQNEFYVPETDPDYVCDESVSEESQTSPTESEHGQGDSVSILSNTNKGKTSTKLKAKGQRHAEGQGQRQRPEVKGLPETNHIPGPSGDGSMQASSSKEHGLSQKQADLSKDGQTDKKMNESHQGPECTAVDSAATKLQLVKGESKSMTPAGRVNVVTDVEGRRASSSISRGRSGSDGKIVLSADRPSSKCPPRSVSETTDTRGTVVGVQDSGITSTTDPALFLDSDTLTDPDASMDSTRSGSNVSSFMSDSYAESPYTSESSFISESSFTADSFNSGSETGTLSTETSSASMLMELSSDSGSDNETVAVTIKPTGLKLKS